MLVGVVCFQLFAPIHVFAGSHDHSLSLQMDDSDMKDVSTCMSVCMRAIEKKNVQPVFLSNDFSTFVKTDSRLVTLKTDNFHSCVQKRTRPDVRLCLIQEFRE
jgi:hypothetical protein